MSIALDPKATRRFISSADLDLPEPEQTWWTVSDLSERERVDYMDAISVKQGATGELALVGGGTKVYVALKAGLTGVEETHPLRDRHGKVVLFELGTDGNVSDEFLERLDWREQREIAEDIAKNLTLLGADLEKSEPSPTDS